MNEAGAAERDQFLTVARRYGKIGLLQIPTTCLALLVTVVCCWPTIALAQTAYQGRIEKLPVKVAPQPIPFSHKIHSRAGVKCLDCHSGATRKERAGLPTAGQCMLCHATVAKDRAAIQELSSLAERGGELRWVRVYQVPDFVFFSHVNHTGAGERCSTCHGAVQERDVLAREVSTSMIVCMNCHAQRQVSNECFLCHDLGQ